MQSAWVDRKATPWEPFAGEPDLAVEDFHDLAAALDA
jgi:2-haloacid dehalogenase